jgi:hypothetical protein
MNEKQKQKLLRMAKIADTGEVGIADELNLLEDKIDLVDEKATQALNMEAKEGINGDNGKDGIDGKDGKNGVDGKNGKDGKDGKDGIDGIDGKDGSPDTAQDIADKLNKEEGIIDHNVIRGFQDAMDIKMSEGISKGISRSGGMSGMNVYVAGSKKGIVKAINFAGMTYSKVNGLDTVTGNTTNVRVVIMS